jgi:hypothetical protein
MNDTHIGRHGLKARVSFKVLVPKQPPLSDNSAKLGDIGLLGTRVIASKVF